VADRLIYVSRLVRLPLIGADETEIGRLADVVLGLPSNGEAPPVHGFVVEVQRRRVFVSGNRVAELAVDGARLRRGSINMRHFELRAGETLVVGEIVGRRVRDARVVDVSIRPTPESSYAWEVATVALGSGGFLGRRRMPRIVDWDEAAGVFAHDGPLARQTAALTQMHPAEMAGVIRTLSPARRRALAEALQDERLADLLEEMPEEDQVRIVEELDLARAARVLDEMEADDAADLLGEMPMARRDQLLGAMDPDEADPVRRLLSYQADTAGGLMTPEPVIMAPTATVADALARIREPDLPATLAAQVFVTAPPLETPTGRYLGLAGYQRLLREVPTKPLARCLDDHPAPIAVDAPEHVVAARVAAYDVVAVPVVDAAGRLVGAVTVDDVLDRILPDEWRRR
jgi:CBS domain-containing protein